MRAGPSRASLLTSSYPTEHGVKTTPGSLDPKSDLGIGVVAESNRQRPNLLRLLSTVGYDVAWKGKWHLSPPYPSSYNASSLLKCYGATSAWNPPDAGHSLSYSSTLGGGRKHNHDGRFMRGVKRRFDTPFKNDFDAGLGEASGKMIDPYISSDDDSDSARAEVEEEESILSFLSKHTISDRVKGGNDKTNINDDQDSSASSQPFFLIASLVNPHDVWAAGAFSNLTDDEFFRETGYRPQDFETLPIELPPNYSDNLSSKPLVQSLLREHPVFGNLSDGGDNAEHPQQSAALRYIRFYAHLHRIIDAEIGSLLDALGATAQMDNTIIVRMSDHGELALSHGLREKRMQCYEETMGIPLIINYPSGWFDKGTATSSTTTRFVSSLVSSIDILPTIADLAGVDCSRYYYRGKSLLPFLRNGENYSSVDNGKEEILFTFDEPLAPPGIPGFVRCMRTSTYKYAVTFTIDGKVMEYELYDLEADPYEMNNLCAPNVEPDERWYNYHEQLTNLMKKMGATPTEFDWDKLSKPRKYSWTS